MNTAPVPSRPLRPADVCKALLVAPDASEGRRRSRKRDQTPDAFGLALKRTLLRQAVEQDPPAEAFEAWLLKYPSTCHPRALVGPASAIARAVFEDWQIVHSISEFRTWLEQGAPSEDAIDGTRTSQ